MRCGGSDSGDGGNSRAWFGYTHHYTQIGGEVRGHHTGSHGHAPPPTFLVRGRVGVTGNICGEAQHVQRERGRATSQGDGMISLVAVNICGEAQHVPRERGRATSQGGLDGII